jgi:hypothetical protein
MTLGFASVAHTHTDSDAIDNEYRYSRFKGTQLRLGNERIQTATRATRSRGVRRVVGVSVGGCRHRKQRRQSWPQSTYRGGQPGCRAGGRRHRKPMAQIVADVILVAASGQRLGQISGGCRTGQRQNSDGHRYDSTLSAPSYRLTSGSAVDISSSSSSFIRQMLLGA